MNASVANLLESPIIPAVEIAGVRIGDTRDQVLAKIGKPSFARPGLRKPIYRERLHYAGLSVALEEFKVFMVIAEVGYKGATKEGLRAGASWSELNQIYPNVAFYETKMVWYVPGINGMSFSIVRPPHLHEIPAMIPYVDEEYQMVDPTGAFVYSISVHDLRYD